MANWLALTKLNALYLIKYPRILCVYAEDKYTLARVVDEPNPFFLQCNPSLISIEGDLLAAGFLRVSRSHVVNKALILRVYRSEALKYHVDLVDDVSVDVSRRYASAAKAAVMGCGV